MSDKDCFDKAQARGDMTFTLVGQDRSSPKTILTWIMENFETCSDAKLSDAFRTAIAMKHHPKRKAAD